VRVHLIPAALRQREPEDTRHGHMPLAAEWRSRRLARGHPLADQRRGESAAGGDKLLKLAVDIETEEHEAELFRIRRKSGGFGRLD